MFKSTALKMCEEWKKAHLAKKRLMALKVKGTAIEEELAITNAFMDLTRNELDNAVAECNFHGRLCLDPPCCSVACVSLMATKEEYVESFVRGMDQTRKALAYRSKTAILKTTLARDVAQAAALRMRLFAIHANKVACERVLAKALCFRRRMGAIRAAHRKAERKLILEKAWAEIERDLAQRERAQSPSGYRTPPQQVRVMRPARIAFPTLSELLALPPPPPQQPEVRLMRPNPNVVATFAQFPGTIENHFAEIAPTVPNSPAEEEEGQGGGN
jgi:hypothetical protein